METFITIFISSLISVIITRLIYKPKVKPEGQLRIDNSDPDGPFMFLEIYKGVGDISKKDTVTLKVCNESYISQD